METIEINKLQMIIYTLFVGLVGYVGGIIDRDSNDERLDKLQDQITLIQWELNDRHLDSVLADGTAVIVPQMLFKAVDHKDIDAMLLEYNLENLK